MVGLLRSRAEFEHGADTSGLADRHVVNGQPPSLGSSAVLKPNGQGEEEVERTIGVWLDVLAISEVRMVSGMEPISALGSRLL